VNSNVPGHVAEDSSGGPLVASRFLGALATFSPDDEVSLPGADGEGKGTEGSGAAPDGPQPESIPRSDRTSQRNWQRRANPGEPPDTLLVEACREA
jgi:hypothetical protein